MNVNDYLVIIYNFTMTPYGLLAIFLSLSFIVYLLATAKVLRSSGTKKRGKKKQKKSILPFRRKKKKKREPTTELTEPRERGPFFAIMIIAVMVLSIVYVLARIFGVA